MKTLKRVLMVGAFSAMMLALAHAEEQGDNVARTYVDCVGYMKRLSPAARHAAILRPRQVPDKNEDAKRRIYSLFEASKQACDNERKKLNAAILNSSQANQMHERFDFYDNAAIMILAANLGMAALIMKEANSPRPPDATH